MVIKTYYQWYSQHYPHPVSLECTDWQENYGIKAKILKGVVRLRKKNSEVLFASNLKMAETLKAELVEAVGTIFKAMLKADQAKISEALASVITITYILGSKLGIDFHTIDLLAQNNLKSGMTESCERDQWYEDMNHLMLYLGKRKKG